MEPNSLVDLGRLCPRRCLHLSGSSPHLFVDVIIDLLFGIISSSICSLVTTATSQVRMRTGGPTLRREARVRVIGELPSSSCTQALHRTPAHRSLHTCPPHRPLHTDPTLNPCTQLLHTDPASSSCMELLHRNFALRPFHPPPTTRPKHPTS